MWITEDAYLPALLTLLDQARKSVDIISFSFAIGSAGGKLNFDSPPFQVAQKLVEIKKKKPNLRIRLYIEGARETSERNAVTVRYLKKKGVEVKMGATHAKGFCVDGQYLLFGSTNLTQQSMTKNLETNLFIQDRKLAKEFLVYFEHMWKGGGHGEIHLKKPWLADGDFKADLIETIDRAKTRLEFSIYFFHLTEIEKAFVRAHERGVKVVGLFSNHQSFAFSYVRRTRGTAVRLRDAGLKHLYYGSRSTFTHSKYLIADRKEVLLGTGNWLHEDVKVHPQLYLHLKDAKLASGLAKHLTKQLRGSSIQTV